MVDPFLNPRVTEAQGPPEAESTSGDESSSSVEEYAENSHSSGTAEAEAPMFNEDPLPQFRLAHLAEEEALVTRVRVLEGQLGYFVLPQEEEGGYEKLLLENLENAAKKLIKGLMNGMDSRGGDTGRGVYGITSKTRGWISFYATRAFM